MLYFITMSDNKFTIELYLDQIRHAIDFPAGIVSYEEAERIPSFRDAVVIFCDIERFPQDMLSIPRDLYNRIAAEGPRRMLNNPWKALQRFDLLKNLHRSGINSFNVHRPPVEDVLIRYPVFIRNELDHFGPVTGLLHSKANLQEQLKAARPNRRGSFSPTIVEFCDARSQDGRYHKYGAFYLWNKVVPRHLFFGNTWMVKGITDQLPQDITRENAYISNNYFAEEIDAIFRLANIQYGRVDFAVTAHGFEVFEINTNPTMLDAGDLKSNRKFVTDAFLANFTTAMQGLYDLSL